MKIKYGSGLGIFRESGMLKRPPPLPSHRHGNIIRYAWFGTLMCDKSGTQCRQCCRSCRWGSCHCPSTWLGCRFVCGCLRCVVCGYWCLCYFGRGKGFLLVLFDGTIAVPPRKWQNKTDRTVMLSSMMYAVAKFTCFCSEPIIVAACAIIFNWIICPKKLHRSIYRSTIIIKSHPEAPLSNSPWRFYILYITIDYHFAFKRRLELVIKASSLNIFRWRNPTSVQGGGKTRISSCLADYLWVYLRSFCGPRGSLLRLGWTRPHSSVSSFFVSRLFVWSLLHLPRLIFYGKI